MIIQYNEISSTINSIRPGKRGSIRITKKKKIRTVKERILRNVQGVQEKLLQDLKTS